jgi:hypothetical protein
MLDNVIAATASYLFIHKNRVSRKQALTAESSAFCTLLWKKPTNLKLRSSTYVGKFRFLREITRYSQPHFRNIWQLPSSPPRDEYLTRLTSRIEVKICFLRVHHGFDASLFDIACQLADMP